MKHRMNVVNVEQESPTAFLSGLQEKMGTDMTSKSLRFCYDRLQVRCAVHGRPTALSAEAPKLLFGVVDDPLALGASLVWTVRVHTCQSSAAAMQWRYWVASMPRLSSRHAVSAQDARDHGHGRLHAHSARGRLRHAHRDLRPRVRPHHRALR